MHLARPSTLLLGRHKSSINHSKGGTLTRRSSTVAEFQMDYIIKAIQKLQREHIKSMAVS